MDTPKNKPTAVEKILKLVDELTPNEQAEVQRKLNLREWGKHWDALKNRIESNRATKGLPPMTEEEVYAEFTMYRREQRAKRAKGNR